MPKKKSPDSRATPRRSVKRTDSAEPVEIRLSRVVERDGIPVSVAGHRKVSGIKRVPRDSFSVTPSSPVESDRVQRLDHGLVQRVHGKAAAKMAKPIQIRFEAHNASPFQLNIEGPVSHQRDEERERIEASMDEWLAPFDLPPLVEHLGAQAGDLFIEEVDPHVFADQFTPADADTAFREQYNPWSKLRSPFIRWEIATIVMAGERLVESEEAASDILSLSTEDSVTEPWTPPALVPRWHRTRLLAGFFVLLVVACVPAGMVMLSRSITGTIATVKAQGALALSDVQQAFSIAGPLQAQVFGQASDRLAKTNQTLSHANTIAVAVAGLLPQTHGVYQSGKALLQAGQLSAQVAQLLSEGLNRALTASVLHPDERVSTFLTYVDSATPLLEGAAHAAGDVDASQLPESVRPRIKELKSGLATAQASLRELRAMADFLLAAAGHDRDRTYLLIFQNPTELRPTGGFMGSFAEVTLDRGELKAVRVPGGGPYDLKSQLTARVVPPKPLQLVDARWEFQDANWFPDFPAAARKIAWFWSKSGEPTLDGVVAVNATLMQKLLAITGPIAMPEYGKTITMDNFLLETQKAVEVEYDKTENQPKKFIGDLMPKMLARIREGSPQDMLNYLSLLAQSIETKDVQMYVNDQDAEAQIERLGWNGRMKPAFGDALAIIEANIAGQKTDGAIREQVAHDVTIRDDGSITDTVTLHRTHTAQKGELFRGVNNVEYLRVYVPQGSELVSASGFDTPSSTLFKQPRLQDKPDADVLSLVHESETQGDVTVTDEFGRTAFGGWIQLEPGQFSDTTLTYTLPFNALDLARLLSTQNDASTAQAAYALLLTSQSGKSDRRIRTTVHWPADWTAKWLSTGTTSTDLNVSDVWDRDRAVAGLFELPHVQTQTFTP